MSYSNKVFFLTSILAMAHSSDDNFQFSTLKPKLYPFVPAFSGMQGDSLMTEMERQLPTNDQMEMAKWAWLFIVLTVKFIISTQTNTHTPVCLGILITRSDVLSTCSCIHRALHSNTTGTSDPEKQPNLMVKPKTAIVEWDPMMKPVTHVHYHESCSLCNGSTSYNDLALLTVEIFDIIYGLIETVPHRYIERKTPKAQLFKDCYIATMGTTPYKKKNGEEELSPEPMSKRNFTVLDFPSPTNYLNTTIIVGQTTFVLPNLEPRFAGSPLICSDNLKREVLLGIYLGLVCPEPKVKISGLKKNCTEQQPQCEDCFPKPLNYLDMYDKDLCTDNSYEIVLRFDNLNEWLDDNTFEILENQLVPYKKSRSSFLNSPRLWIILIFILLTKALFN